ncbi:MAG: MFS transporter [Chloroflexota bacterium]|nr:MFS transporter [Chloroflexota bacterium]
MNQSSARRISISLFISQGIISAAMIAVFTVMAIVAADLGGSGRWAGVPILAMFIGRFLASYLMGRLMDLWGRRPSLAGAFLLGFVGAALAVASILNRNFPGFVVAALIFGMARGGAEQMRFIAAEVQMPNRRAWAIGIIVFAGTIGSVFGPWIYQATATAAAATGYDQNVGPWAAAVVLMGLAMTVVYATLRPDPRELGRQIAVATESGLGPAIARPMSEVFTKARVRLAVVSVAVGQVVMTILMAVTPLHMTQEGYFPGDISIVMGAHMLGMFGLAPLTGRLVDRLGPYWVIAGGATLLVVTCGFAFFAASVSVLALALFLLGLGWNLTFVAGSALLMSMVTQAERARSQGITEMVNSLTGGLAALSSGFLLVFGGLRMLAVGGLMLTAILVVAQAWVLAMQAHRRPVPVASPASPVDRD